MSTAKFHDHTGITAKYREHGTTPPRFISSRITLENDLANQIARLDERREANQAELVRLFGEHLKLLETCDHARAKILRATEALNNSSRRLRLAEEKLRNKSATSTTPGYLRALGAVAAGYREVAKAATMEKEAGERFLAAAEDDVREYELKHANA